MTDDLSQRGLAAAIALAKRLGLPAGDPEVLSDRGNLLVRFPAAGVVARVATRTAWTRREPSRWLARELEVARHVAAQGGPAIPPALAVDPGPHQADGFAVSFFEYVAFTDPAPAPTPATCGTQLARFHLAARDCPAYLPWLAPATEQVSDAIAVIEREALADPATIAALRDVHARVLAQISDTVGGTGDPVPNGDPALHRDDVLHDEAVLHGDIVLHGDAHAGNLLATPDGDWRWTDLEETSRGPAAWDLATLAASYEDADAKAALAAYAREAGVPVPAVASLAPFARARDLEAAVWLVCMARLYPARYEQAASDQLAKVLSLAL
jgi:Ser/Thr protein kinase RdoA (MazF antagonist)